MVEASCLSASVRHNTLVDYGNKISALGPVRVRFFMACGALYFLSVANTAMKTSRGSWTWPSWLHAGVRATGGSPAAKWCHYVARPSISIRSAGCTRGYSKVTATRAVGKRARGFGGRGLHPRLFEGDR